MLIAQKQLILKKQIHGFFQKLMKFLMKSHNLESKYLAINIVSNAIVTQNETNFPIF